VLVNLKAIRGLDQIEVHRNDALIGGLVTLDALSRHPRIRKEYTVLAEAAEKVGTPQIRNAGTLAVHVWQRPWCWYFRNGFPCLENGGKICFSSFTSQGRRVSACGRGLNSFNSHASTPRAKTRYRRTKC
jgi:xanthine dehydrogenase YagS FAD-binding subunit